MKICIIKRAAVLFITLSVSAAVFNASEAAYGNMSAGGVSLELMYNFGGCDDNLYTAESYYIAPIIRKNNSDGRYEIVYANYSIIVIDAVTGELIWRVNGGKDRSAPYIKVGGDLDRVSDLVIADIDGDGEDEIISAHGRGVISVLSRDGYMKPGWPQQLYSRNGSAVTAKVSSLEVCDLDGDGRLAIIAGASTLSPECVWAYRYDGALISGWPQLSPDQDATLLAGDSPDGAFSYGVFMDGVASGDIDGDGRNEILVATDTAYISAFDRNGRLVRANRDVFSGRAWGKIAVWEDAALEYMKEKNFFNQGWGGADEASTDARSKRYRAELGHANMLVADIDGDGKNEVITSAIVVDRIADKGSPSAYVSSRYMSVFIFNGDRTRYRGWEQAPSDRDYMAAPLIQDPADMASGVMSRPVVADINNDGVNEVVLNTYDGRVHAFSIKTAKEINGFPFMIPQADGTAETPNAVVCADINGDGKKEIIFTTCTVSPTLKGEPSKKGVLNILKSDGSPLASAEFPDGYIIYETKKPAYINSSFAAPAVADIDGDGLCEIAVNTRYSGICVYKVLNSNSENLYDQKSPAASFPDQQASTGNPEDQRPTIANLEDQQAPLAGFADWQPPAADIEDQEPPASGLSYQGQTSGMLTETLIIIIVLVMVLIALRQYALRRKR